MRRSAVLLGAAGLAYLFIETLLPLPAGDPFRGTLLVVPWVVAALSLIERAVWVRGPRPGPRDWPSGS